MKIKNFFYKLSASFLVASSLSFTIGSIAFISFRELLKNNDGVTYSYEKIGTLNQIITDLTDIETGVRGYIITGKDLYLQPYYQGLTTIDENINQYKLKIKDTEEQTKFNELVKFKNEKIKELNKGLKIRKEKGFNGVLNINDLQRGRRLMVEAKNVANILNDIEMNKLQLRKEHSENLVVVARLSIIATALLNLLILAMAYNLVQEEIKRREEVEKKLIKTNKALSFSIQDVSTEIDTYLTSGIERKLELEKLNNSLKLLNSSNNK